VSGKKAIGLKVRRFRSWWIASYGELKATGHTRTEAVAHMLLTLRDEVEVVRLQVSGNKEKGGERK